MNIEPCKDSTTFASNGVYKVHTDERAQMLITTKKLPIRALIGGVSDVVRARCMRGAGTGAAAAAAAHWGCCLNRARTVHAPCAHRATFCVFYVHQIHNA